MTSNWLSFTFFNMLLRRALFRDGKLTQFLHFPACFLIVTCFLTSNWLSFYIFLHVFPSWNVSRHQTDSVPTFFNMLSRRDVFLDKNWLSFNIFQNAFPSWRVSWHKSDSVPKFSSMLFRRVVSLDIKPTQFLHYPTWFSVVTCFITSYWLSFYAYQCDSH
jgi:hypothetical protein